MSWYVLRTKNKKENAARRLLLTLRPEINLAVFMPLARVQILERSGKPRIYLVPLFANYIFIRFKWPSRHKIMNTRYVKGFVGYIPGSTYAPSLPASEIRRLKSYLTCVNGCDVLDLAPQISPTPIHPGQMIQILSGAYEGRKAKVDSVDNDDIVSVLLTFANVTKPVMLPRSQLQAA